MKYVTKSKAPESFEKWKLQGNNDWEPSYANLRDPEKSELHRHLLIEQGWVCCYCGRRITQQTSHIEHFRPQHYFPEVALDSENLYASCIRETSPGMPLHCGHAKGNQYNETLAISPLDSECERQFRYTLDGQVIPENEKAIYMNRLLELDIEFLNSRRAEVLQGVFDDDFLISATQEELVRLRENYIQIGLGGYLPDFGHIVARYSEQLLQVLHT